jgi:hypothetical protein
VNNTVTVNAGGTLAPGVGGVGVLRVNNVAGGPVLMLNDGGTLAIAVDASIPAAPRCNSVDVAGPGSAADVSLNDATLTVNVTGTLGPAFPGIVIVNNTAAGSTVSGTFAGLAEGAVFAAANNPSVLFAISYVGGDGNDVVLRRGNRRGTLVLVL